MNRTRRTVGLSAFGMLVVLGTGWALEKASSNSHTQSGAAVSEPAKASDAVTTPVSGEPLDVQPAATHSSPAYDRSDLILSQGQDAGLEALGLYTDILGFKEYDPNELDASRR